MRIEDIVKNLVKIAAVPVISIGLLASCATTGKDYGTVDFIINWNKPHSVENKNAQVDANQNSRTNYFTLYEKQF